MGKAEGFEQLSRGDVACQDPGFQAVEVEMLYRPVGDEPNAGAAVALVAVAWTPNTDTDLGVAVAPVDGVEGAFTDQAADGRSGGVTCRSIGLFVLRCDDEGVFGGWLRPGGSSDLAPELGAAAWAPVRRAELGQLLPVATSSQDGRNVGFSKGVDGGSRSRGSDGGHAGYLTLMYRLSR